MSNTQMKTLEELVNEVQSYKRMAEEISAAIDGLSDQIKAIMGDEEQLVVGAFKLCYKPVIQSRIDSAALKKQMPEIAERFMKRVETRPLRIT